MRSTNRKSAPGVKNGKVQKKNRHAKSPDVFDHDVGELVLRRMRPWNGYYHAVSVTDLKRFIALIPDWEALSKDLRAIVLSPGSGWTYGTYYDSGVITLEAWSRSNGNYIKSQDRWLCDKLGFPDQETDRVMFTKDQARAYMLLAVLTHEIGHHLDRMTTKQKKDSANGEPFAIRFELEQQQLLWDAYIKEFGSPAQSRKADPIYVVPHRHWLWRGQFEDLRAALQKKLRPIVQAIEHVGSTAVPGLAAKPIIDIDVVVEPENISEAIRLLSDLGYEHQGNLGIPGREAFRQPPTVTIDHHLYLCATNSRELKRHLAFRDALREDKKARKEYEELKMRLAEQFAGDRDGYARAKSEFVEGILKDREAR